jgi:hypothetical protein
MNAPLDYSTATDDELLGLKGMGLGRLRYKATKDKDPDAIRALERRNALAASSGGSTTGRYDRLTDAELLGMRASNSLGGLRSAADRGDASARRALARLDKLGSSGGDAA